MNSKRKVIGAVQKAINIVNLYSIQRAELGITEIANILDLPKSTVSGLIYTLEVNGYLYRNQKSRKYRLGYKLAERGGLLLSQESLRQVALPYLEELRDWCNESVNLAIYINAEVLYIERLLGTNTLGMRSEIGKRELVHSTALGKAILSCLPEEDFEININRQRLESVTSKTITDRKQLLKELQETQERGYAIDDEENELGGRCVAAPILNSNDHPIAAISISAPLQRLPISKVPIFGERVKHAAKKISCQMGNPRCNE